MKRRDFLTGLGLVVLATACGSSPTSPGPVTEPPPPPPPPPGPIPVIGVTRILTYGDSLTEGTTSPALPLALTAGIPQSYPYKLQALLAQRYSSQEIVVLNGGRAGEKAVDARDRLGGVLSEARPEVLLLLDSANDLLSIFTPPIPPSPNAVVSAAVNAMEDMFREASARGIPVIVGNLPPQRATGSRGTAAGYVTQYNDQLRQMCARKGARYLDVYGQFDLSLIGQDGLHPTEAGYARLAEIFRVALTDAFEVRT